MRNNDNTNIYVKSRRGSAIAYVLLIFLVVSILSTLVLSLFSGNFKLATHQERSTEAYYLAYSGAELAFAALADNSNELFIKIRDGNIASQSDEITVENGKINITVTRVNTGSDYFLKYPLWIQITSTGTLKSDNTARTRILFIDKADSNNIAWK
jgi:type II secretory pathway component PulK